MPSAWNRPSYKYVTAEQYQNTGKNKTHMHSTTCPERPQRENARVAPAHAKSSIDYISRRFVVPSGSASRFPKTGIDRGESEWKCVAADMQHWCNSRCSRPQGCYTGARPPVNSIFIRRRGRLMCSYTPQLSTRAGDRWADLYLNALTLCFWASFCWCAWRFVGNFCTKDGSVDGNGKFLCLQFSEWNDLCSGVNWRWPLRREGKVLV